MTFYRCEICGEIYFGTEKSSHCPFCGVDGKFLALNSEWVDENKSIGTLSEISIKNLQIALQLEANNAPFYKAAAKKASTSELQGIFKYLGKVEAEHASTIKKILKVVMPKPEAGKEVAGSVDVDNLSAAHEREVSATTFYEKAAGEATEERVIKVFNALAKVEADHAELEAELLKREH